MGYSPIFRGNTLNVPSRTLSTNYTSGSGSTIPKGSVVSSNSSGQIMIIDPSDEASSAAVVGVMNIDLPPAATGGVISGGRIENVDPGFVLGDALYAAKDGTLTNVKPSEGVNGFVAGDFVIFIGVVVKNEFNPAQKDIQLILQVVGEL